jgi:hypothetical protein
MRPFYAVRLSKKEWYAKGGFTNSKLFRQQQKNGGWRYFETID